LIEPLYRAPMSLLPDTWWSRRNSRTNDGSPHASPQTPPLNLPTATPLALPTIYPSTPHSYFTPLAPVTPPNWPSPSPQTTGIGISQQEFPQHSTLAMNAFQRRPAVASLGMDFGLIHNLMIDPTVEEIWINTPQKVFISRHGRSELTNVLMSPELVENLVERCLMWGGRRLDRSHPFVDARLPDGSRLHVAIPDVTAEHWAVNIRKHLMNGKNLEDLCRMGSFPGDVTEILREIVSSRGNLLVSGSTQAGKTTLLNALIAEIPQYERVITIEEVFELRCVLPDVVSLQTRSASLEGTGEITLRDLIKESLRMRPSRLVVGEIREAESLDLLIALNSGIPGMATIHGNSARDAVRKLQTLPLLAGENISSDFIAPTVARSIDYVIHVGIDAKSGERKLREISEVTGRLEGNVIEMHQIYQIEEKLDSPERAHR